MSRLDDLIQELCPNGVEYVSLGDIAHYARNRISASDVNESNYVGVENLLQNKQGKTTANSCPIEGTVIEFRCGDILIGNIRPYLRKIWLSDCDGGTNGDVLSVQIDDRNRIMPEFLYYVLSSEDFFLYDIQNSKGAKMPRGSKEAVLKYSIPVPPLPVQSEIVRILDNFTELTAELIAELTAELTARKKQYSYYRNKLLNFDVDAPIKTIGDVCDVVTGGEAPEDCIKGEISDESHPYPVWGNGKEVYGYSGKYKIDKDAVVISSIGANTGAVYFREAYFTPIIRLKVVLPKNENLNARFLFHALSATEIKSKSSSVPNMNANEIKALQIPVPAIDIQNRIASVLDNFDAICSDLKIGLPAEIEARTKQYEYYRDKLLTFKSAE